MDSRRILIACAALLWSCGGGSLAAGADLVGHAPRRAFTSMEPIANPPEAGERGVRPGSSTSRPYAHAAGRSASKRGLAAIAAANAQALETSRADAFIGGVQVFAYEPGRIYEIWTAPLRVTTLTLGPGESVLSMAAGDTVRWQIGQTVSGDGLAQRAHVMIKPLELGLENNLVLATSQRIYLIELRSGSPRTFNVAVAWDLGAVEGPVIAQAAPASVPDPLITPVGALDANFRIMAGRRPPPWTPTAVMTDGVRTFLAFPATLASQEAPALFVVGPKGEAQMVNYRQQAGLWVVDRVIEKAELRVGDSRSAVVRIVRRGERP